MFQTQEKRLQLSGSIIQRPVAPICPKVLEYYVINIHFLPLMQSKFLSHEIKVP